MVEHELGGRRLRVLRVAPSLLLYLMRQPGESARLTSVGLPDDAQFVAAYLDDERQQFRIYVESEQFEPVTQGAWVPELDVTFTVHYEMPEACEASGT
jgi:hypothetical protein